MEIKFRDWDELPADERDDAVYAVRLWMNKIVPSPLLPCDITAECKNAIVEEAIKAEGISQSCRRTLEAMQ